MSKILSTTVVGSYPQPDWLIDRDVLKGQTVPRVRVKSVWRVAEPFLEAAQDDATLLAIRDMERAGLDVITDGEMRRESYSNRFATALAGIDNDNPASISPRAGRTTLVPRVTAKVRWTGPVEVARCRVPARQHRPAHQDHAAGPVHDGAAGGRRALSTTSRR